MGTVVHYLIVLTPILWWALFAAGLLAYVRCRGLPQLSIAVGAFAYAALSTLSVLFPPSRTLDEEGNILRITEPLVPWQIAVSLSFLGLALVIAGVSVLLLKREQ